MEFLSTNQIQSLNELEMQVYHYVITHQNSVPYMRIRELASEAHISTTTILHFCKKVGCEGYAQFKWRMKENMGAGRQSDRIPDGLSEIQSFFAGVGEEHYERKLEEAATLIARADQVFVAGIGNSGNIGGYAARYFTNLGKFALFVPDPFYPINISQMESSNAAAVVLSVSGETEQIIHTAGALKKNGCDLISITSPSVCTVAQMSDVNLSYGTTVRRGPEKIDYTSQIPAVYLLENLGRRVHNRLAE